MVSFLSSDNLVLIAMLAGLLCFVLNSAIDDLFTVFVFKEPLIDRQEMIAKYMVARYILSGCFGSICFGFIFYAFANTDPNPIRSILAYSFSFGTAVPVLNNLVTIARRKLFPKRQNG